MATPFIATVAIGTALDLRGFATGVGKLRSAASAANGPMGQTTGTTRGLSTALGAASFNLNALSTAANISVGAMTALGASITAVGRTVSAVGLAFGLFAGSIMKTGFDWRKQWNQARAVTSGTLEEMTALEKMVKDLAGTTKFMMLEVAQAVDFLGKAGNTASEQLRLLPTMLDLAAAAGSDLGRTADIMTNIAQGLGIPLDEIARHGDMITATFLNSNVTLEMFGDSMKKLAPLTAQLQIPFHQMATAIGLMGNAGIQASEAGVHLRRALLNLSDTTSPLRTKLVEMLGLDWDALDVTKHGLIPVLSTVSSKLLTALNKYDRAVVESSAEFGIAGDLFGGRAVSTTLALLGQLGEGYDELNTKVRGSAGAMRETAAAQLEGIEGFYRLQAVFANAKIAISESGVLDLFEDLANKLADLFNEFSAAADETKRLVFNIAVLGTAVGPALIGIGLAISTLAKFGQSALFIGQVLGFLLTPLGAAVAGIFAIAGIAAYTATHGIESFEELFDGSSPFLTALGDAVLAIVGAVHAAISGEWDEAWAYAKDIIANVAAAIVMVMAELVNALLEMFQDILNFVSEHWEEIVNNSIEAMRWLFTESDAWLLAFGLLFLSAFRNLAIGVVARVVWMVNTIRKAVFWLGGQLLAVFILPLTKVLNAFARLGNRIGGIATKIANSLYLVLGGAATWIGTKFASAFKWIAGRWTAFKNFITGPNGVLKVMGRNAAKLWAFIVDAARHPLKTLRAAVTSPFRLMAFLVRGILLGLALEVAEVFQRMLDGVAEMIRHGVKLIANEMAGFIESLPWPLNKIFTPARWVWEAIAGEIEYDSIADAFSAGWNDSTIGNILGKLTWIPKTSKEELSEYADHPAYEQLMKGAVSLDSFLAQVGETPAPYEPPAAPELEEAAPYVHEEAPEEATPAAAAYDEDADETDTGLFGDIIKFFGGILDSEFVADLAGLGAEMTEEAWRALLGVVEPALKDLALLVNEIKPINDVNPEEIKNKIYSLLGGIPGLDPAQIPGLEAFGRPDGLAHATPTERKQAALTFLDELGNDILGRLKNLLPYQEEGAPLPPDMLNLMAEFDRLERKWGEIADKMPTAATTLDGDGTGIGTDAAGTDRTSGGSRYASLTGALKDLQLDFRLFIGDQEIEDLVVEAIAQAVREDRLRGVSVT